MINVTAIIVSYNTPDLLKKCYESIRRFYPYLHCIIIDGSDRENPCYEYARSRSKQINTVVNVGRNIGHGPGMVMGIKLCKTEYFLLMDSDVTINKPGTIEFAMSCFEKNTDLYGVGQIVYVNDSGMNVVPKNTKKPALHYLHPHFALLKKSEYEKYAPIINHGSPMLNSMISLGEEAKTKLVHIRNLTEFITHHERGTRKLNPRAFHPRFWDGVNKNPPAPGIL